jgi:hypothetical protein
VKMFHSAPTVLPCSFRFTYSSICTV